MRPEDPKKRMQRELPDGSGNVDVNEEGLQRAQSALEDMKRKKITNETATKLQLEHDKMELFVAEMQMHVWFDEYVRNFLGTSDMPTGYRFEVKLQPHFEGENEIGNLNVIIEFHRFDLEDALDPMVPYPNINSPINGFYVATQYERQINVTSEKRSLLVFTKEAFLNALETNDPLRQWLITTSKQF